MDVLTHALIKKMREKFGVSTKRHTASRQAH